MVHYVGVNCFGRSGTAQGAVVVLGKSKEVPSESCPLARTKEVLEVLVAGVANGRRGRIPFTEAPFATGCFNAFKDTAPEVVLELFHGVRRV